MIAKLKLKENLIRLEIGVLTSILVCMAILSSAYATSLGQPYDGVPKVTIEISDLDDSGNLIYCGFDVAVFYDPDKDGQFTVLPDDSKIMRYITRNTKVTLDIGSPKDYPKGIEHKLAIRTLYVPVGVKQEPIVIANSDNGNDGWEEIPGTLFKPSYFINAQDQPYIAHTLKWDENREVYNNSRISLNEDEKVRDENVFWSGEKLKLHIEVGEVVSGVAIKILGETDSKGETFKVVLRDYEEHPTINDAVIYEGELWDEEMMHKWGNYIPKELKVQMDILDSDGNSLETKNVFIFMDNRDLFYRNSKVY